jgi:hypothetical protein
MRLALSPYEIGGCSVAAATAVVLAGGGGGVLTLKPSPFEAESAAGVREIVATAPSFARLLESWRWTGPLWREGVLEAALEGRALAGALGRMVARMRADVDVKGLSALVHEAAIGDESGFLEAISRDVLRGGADPSVCLPIIALMEEVAAARGAALVCGESSGMLWRAKGGDESVGTASFPVAVGMDGESLLGFRERLAREHETLGDVLGARLLGEAGGEARLDRAVRALERSFAEAWAACGREGGMRAVRVVVTMTRMREGAAVREAARRMVAITGGGGIAAPVERAIEQPPRMLIVMRVKRSAWDVAWGRADVEREGPPVRSRTRAESASRSRRTT